MSTSARTVTITDHTENGSPRLPNTQSNIGSVASMAMAAYEAIVTEMSLERPQNPRSRTAAAAPMSTKISVAGLALMKSEATVVTNAEMFVEAGMRAVYNKWKSEVGS